MSGATITIGIDPFVHLGPLTLAWHGLTIAFGITAGAFVARRRAVREGLDPDPVLSLVLVVAFFGIAGSRALYLAEQAPGDLLRPSAWLGTRGFAFYGALIGGTLAVAVLLRRRRLSLRYLDVLAFAFPVGMAIGRVGDVINGEHFGPATTAPWGIRYTHPDAEVPGSVLAYHSGGLYEVVLALVLLPAVLLLASRLRAPGSLLWLVIALYGAGRFAMFFYREDSDTLLAGLNSAQWLSLGLIAAAATGWAASSVVTRWLAGSPRRLDE